MRHVVLIAILAAGLWGLFRAAKEMKALWRQGGKKDVLVMVALFAICPIILTFLYRWQIKAPNLWLVAPLLIASFVWVCSGYLMTVAAQKRLAGQEKALWPPEQIKKKAVLYGILLLIGLALWIMGFQGHLVQLSFEEALLILSIYLIAVGFSGWLRICRSIIYHNRKIS